MGIRSHSSDFCWRFGGYLLIGNGQDHLGRLARARGFLAQTRMRFGGFFRSAFSAIYAGSMLLALTL